MKELLIALAMAWAVMTMVGCAPAKQPVAFGDHSGHQYKQVNQAFVQDLTTGQLLSTVGPNWVRDDRGQMHFRYGNFIEDAPRGSRSESGGRSR